MLEQKTRNFNAKAQSAKERKENHKKLCASAPLRLCVEVLLLACPG
jgi:hypothetical protein